MRVAAIMLAAGFGTRLAPLTDVTPKPLLIVGDQPVASHLTDRLREVSNLNALTVVVNNQHPEQWYDWANSQSAEPPITIVATGATTSDNRNGAVADLARAVDATPRCDWLIVVAGDNLLDESLQPHVDAAIKSGAPVVLCRHLGDAVPPGRFGEVTVDDSNTVTAFREKPADPQSPLAATCTYVLPGDIATDLVEYLAGGDVDSPGRFIGWLAQRRRVTARRLTGRYFDIGNHETLAGARAQATTPPGVER